jgi:hypothetical protein
MAWDDSVEVFFFDGVRYSDDDCWANEEGETLPEGWYFWSCFPGCMPEGDPNGPYDSEDAAWAAADEMWNDDEDEDEDEDETAE